MSHKHGPSVTHNENKIEDKKRTFKEGSLFQKLDFSVEVPVLIKSFNW